MSREQRDSREPFHPSPLPLALMAFLKERPRAIFMHGTNIGTVFVVKLPGKEIRVMPNPVPIHLRQELYRHPNAPVIRLVATILDRPRNPLALETYVNIEDEYQRRDYQALANQDQLHMLFYDEAGQHRLTKQITHPGKENVNHIIAAALALLGSISADQFRFPSNGDQYSLRTWPHCCTG